MKRTRILVILFLVVMVIFGLLLDPCGILTETTPDFKIGNWKFVEIGDSQEKVQERLGEPFLRVTIPWHEAITEQWHYSRKRSAIFLFRDYRVYFSNNIVVAKGAWISEDCKASKAARESGNGKAHD